MWFSNESLLVVSLRIRPLLGYCYNQRLSVRATTAVLHPSRNKHFHLDLPLLLPSCPRREKVEMK